MTVGRKNLFAWIIVAGLGVLGTWQYHRAQFSSRFDIFFGDRGDARGFVYFCEHWFQAFLGKTNVLSPGIFYPAKGTLAYSDLLLGYAIPYSLFRALGFGMFSSVEIVVIAIAFLSYIACFILLKRVLRFSLLPSCAGALFFAFSSPKFFQTGHIQLQFVLFLPLIFICVISFVQKAEHLDQKRAALWLSLAGIFLNLQLMTAFYYAWFFVFWSFLLLTLGLVFRTSRLFMFSLIKKYWPAMGAASAIFLLGFIPFLLIYAPTVRVGTWYSYSNVSLMIPEWWSLLSMGDGNYVWGWLAAAVRPNPWPATWGELMIGIGLVPSLTWLLLTAWAVWLLKKHHNPIATKPTLDIEVEHQNVARMFLAVMILATTLFYLLGLKYWGGHSPWYFVYHSFPGTGAMRAMARYVIFLTLPMAIAFAFILDSGLKWKANHKSLSVRRGATLAIALLAGFSVFEQFGSFKVGGTGFSVRAEEAYLNAMARKLPHDCEAFYIAAGQGKHNPFEYQYDAMLISILSGVPTLNASSSQFPPNWSLYLVKEPDYERNVEKWISLQHIDGKVCRLQIGPQVEAFSYHAPNPIDDPVFFVSQQYRDVLNREPRSEEINASVERLKSCKSDDPGCSRPQIALDIFHSTQFYEKGSFILRVYEAGLGRMPRYEEFLKEMQRLATYQDSEPSESAREKFVAEFIRTTEFASHHNGLSDSEYREKLLKTVQVNPIKDKLKSGIGNENTRSRILLDIVESDEASRKLSNRAFVALHYFAYLRRDPDGSGFEQWLATLYSNNDFRHVTSGFINSSEYRERFGI